jgi:FtsH-binding integral membrane protein
METKREESRPVRGRTKPNLSLVALVAFIASFTVARTFTSLNPDTVLIGGEFHIHHFWYGLAMLAIGGWIGISYESERVSRLAAILFGAGGGLIGDEVGLLLTLENYWSEITYTLVVTFLAIASMLVLLNRYSKIIRTELGEFLSGNAALYFGVFLAAVSIAFILETDNTAVIVTSSIGAIVAFALLIAYFLSRIRKKRREKE